MSSDDLDRALPENLKLRSELAANVAKAKGSASQRVSRGFNRLGFFLAAISFVIGGTFAVLAGYVCEQGVHPTSGTRMRAYTCREGEVRRELLRRVRQHKPSEDRLFEEIWNHYSPGGT